MSFLNLYKKHHLDKDYESLGLFEQLKLHHNIETVFYPGSYAHITPSIVFSHVIYNDVYKNLVPYYNSGEMQEYIQSRKEYDVIPYYEFIHGDYTKPLPLEDQSFDLIISQYSGFISLHCMKYLKIGGILMANNSHGDAGMAHFLENYQLIAIMNRNKSSFSYSTKNLDDYFKPKKEIEITQEYLEKLGRGVGYTKTAQNYVFRRET